MGFARQEYCSGLPCPSPSLTDNEENAEAKENKQNQTIIVQLLNKVKGLKFLFMDDKIKMILMRPLHNQFQDVCQS